MTNNPSSTIAVPGGGRRFSRETAELLGGNGPTDLTQLSAVARRVMECPGMFVSWLDEMCRHDSLVAEAAARSYWHPNGFAKLVLHTSAESEFRIRLHVWPVTPGQPRRGESNPHSHRWEFASTVIVGGGLHMVEYRESTHGGRPYDRYRYGNDLTDSAALLSDGEVRLIRTASPHVRRGQVYSCDTTVVHTVVPIETDLTATVVIQGRRRTQSTVVYCEPGRGDDQPNGELTESDFRWLVKSVLDECESAS